MKKQEFLEDIAEIPDDAEILVYHVTRKTEEGQGTKGGITATGQQAIMHVYSAMKHVSECLGIEIEDLGNLIGMYTRWKARREDHKETGETVEVNTDLLEKLMGGLKDDQ